MSRLARPRMVLVFAALVGCGSEPPPAGDGTATTTTSTTSTGDTTTPALTDSGATSDNKPTTAAFGDTSTGEPVMCPPLITGDLVTVHGVVEKGPAIAGTLVEIAVLDLQGQPTGQTLVGATTDDLGAYSIPDVPSGPIVVTATGQAFDELANAVSPVPVSLRAFARAGLDSTAINVNVLTHITAPRAIAEFAAGACLDDALNTARDDLKHFYLAHDFVFARPVHQDTLVGIDDDDNAYLLAFSAVLLQAAQTPPALQARLDLMAEDLAKDLPTPSPWHLMDAEADLPTDLVHDRLADYLQSMGLPAALPDMHRILDQDHDLTVNADDNCRYVFNINQLDADNDGIGDVCDCGDQPCDCDFSSPDGDGDHYPDACDNCPLVANDSPGQDVQTGSFISDQDGDGLGNACDSCPNSPGVGAIAGENCCDPRDTGVCLMEPNSHIPETCVWHGPRFECDLSLEPDCPYLGYGMLACQDPIAPPGALAPVCNSAECNCDDISCNTRYCTLPGDDACDGDLNVCIPWYLPGTAPAGLADLGVCARVDAGPCVGKVGVECMG